MGHAQHSCKRLDMEACTSTREVETREFPGLAGQPA